MVGPKPTGYKTGGGGGKPPGPKAGPWGDWAEATGYKAGDVMWHIRGSTGPNSRSSRTTGPAQLLVNSHCGY